MSITPIKVLLIEMNSRVYSNIIKMLDKSENAKFEVINTSTFNNGLKILETNKFDIILLDLDLSNNEGLIFGKILLPGVIVAKIYVANQPDRNRSVRITKTLRNTKIQ